MAGLVAHQDTPVALNLDLQQGHCRSIGSFKLSIPMTVCPPASFSRATRWPLSYGKRDSDAPVFAPAVTWICGDGRRSTRSASTTATLVSLALGVYYIMAHSDPGRSIGVAACPARPSTVTLQAAPGNIRGAGRSSYCTVADIRSIAGWIDQVSAPNKETGFLTECAQSRSWLDENILRNYRGGNVELLGYHGLALDSWYTGGSRRTSLRNSFILDLLQQNAAGDRHQSNQEDLCVLRPARH